MRTDAHRALLGIAGAMVIAMFMSGCTLTGANAAPLTPVVTYDMTASGGGQGQQLPTPTEMPLIDVFGTQTAMAPTPTVALPTVEVTDSLTPGVLVEGTPGVVGEGTPMPLETPSAGETPSVGTPGACPATHTVQAGENLFRIAMQYGLTYQALAAANGITNPDAIQVGMVLSIPGCSGTAATSGGTGTGDILYTIQAGDNLFRIALRYGLDWRELATYNGISNADVIEVGQVIRIPQR